MPRVIDLGAPYGHVSFADDATDDQVVAEFEKLETDRLRALKEAKLITVRLADLANTDEPSIGKTLTRTGLAIREGAVGSTKQSVGNIARSFADLFSRPVSPLQDQPDTSSPELPVNILREAGKTLAQEGTTQRKEASELGKAVGGGIPASIMESLGETAGVSAPALLAAPLGLGAAAVAGGLQSYGLNLSGFADLIQDRNPNLSEEEAFQKAQLPAALTGAATGVFTRAFGGVERFIERIAREGLKQQGVKELIKSAWRGASMEFPEEYGDQLAQGLIEKALVNPDKPIADIFNEAGMAGLAGLTIGGVTVGGLSAAGSAAKAIADKVSGPSRMRREDSSGRVRTIANEAGEVIQERPRDEQTQATTPSPAAIAPVQAPPTTVTKPTAQPPAVPVPVTPPPLPVLPPVTTPITPFDVKGGDLPEANEAKKEGQEILKPVLSVAETAAGGRSKPAAEIETPATPVAGSLKVEPVPETPAPTPVAATSEFGSSEPVPAGLEPPAKAIVPPDVPVAKAKGKRTLTTPEEAFVENRSSPKQGTPERTALDDKLEAEINLAQKSYDSWYALNEQLQKTGRYTKKYEQLEKKRDKAYDTYSKFKGASEAARKQRQLVMLEDLAESNIPIASDYAAAEAMAQRYLLRGDQVGSRYSPEQRARSVRAAGEETAEAKIIEMLIGYGLTTDEAKSEASTTMSMLTGYPIAEGAKLPERLKRISETVKERRGGDAIEAEFKAITPAEFGTRFEGFKARIEDRFSPASAKAKALEEFKQWNAERQAERDREEAVKSELVDQRIKENTESLTPNPSTKFSTRDYGEELMAVGRLISNGRLMADSDLIRPAELKKLRERPARLERVAQDKGQRQIWDSNIKDAKVELRKVGYRINKEGVELVYYVDPASGSYWPIDRAYEGLIDRWWKGGEKKVLGNPLNKTTSGGPVVFHHGKQAIAVVMPFARGDGTQIDVATALANASKVKAEPSTDVIDAALTRAIEATDLTRGQTLEGITGAPVWLTLSLANGALRVLRSAYRAGKTIAEAVSDAVAWLRTKGIDQFDESTAKAWLESMADEDGPEINPLGGVQVEGASAEVGRIAESIVKEREVAGRELEGLAYERKQFKMARSELKRLADIAYGRLGASLQEEPGRIIPDPRDGIEISEDGVIEVDDTFTDILSELSVEHDPENVKDMQAEIFFENAAKRLNNLLANAETLRNAVGYYQALKVDEAEIRKITRSLNRLNNRAAKLGAAELNGTSVSQRAAEVRAAEIARPGRMAKRDSLSLDPVADFFGRQVGAYRGFMSKVNAAVKLAEGLRNSATTPDEIARLSEEADKWLRLPEEVRTSIASGKPLTNEQRAAAFATLAEVFDDFDILKARMTEMQTNRAPAIEDESKSLLSSIATAKIESGMAEVMIADVLAALDGESGGTGTLQSQAMVQELRGRLTAIQNFAMSVGRDLETNAALFEWLANPTDKPAFALSNANAFGTTPEVIQMILAEVKRNPDFGSAIVTLVESSNKKLANLPITQLEAISALVKDGKVAEARAQARQIMSRANARASLAEVARRGDLKKLDALEIERLSLDQGLAMFSELDASREFNSVRALVANSPFGLVEPMVAQNNTTTTFKPFGGSGIPAHSGLEISATDNPTLKDTWFKKIAEWHKSAQEHLDAYEAALALNSADPANNPAPATLGFDLSKIRGLRDAVTRFVPGSFLELSLLSENGRWKVPWIVKWMNRTAWFRQHDFVAKMVGGQSGTDLRGKLGDFVNNFLSSRAIIQRYRDIPDKLHQAMRSHPELKMNMADYRALWNEMAHWGRLFGSPVKVGFVLPVSGKVVTQQDITLLHRQRAFEEALRRQVTETTPVAGVRLQRGGRELVRSGAYVGDEGLPRHLNRQADSFIADILSVYSPAQGQTKTNGFDSTTDISASSTHPVVQFWNQRTDLLVQHVLDSRRGDRVVRLGPMMQPAETDTAVDWMTTGTPTVQSLEDVVNQLVAHFPPAPGMNVRDQVIQGLNDELRQYRDAASRIEQERREREQARSAGVSIAFSADNEFTRPAAKLELPSRFYDYGAITPGEHLVVTSRSNHERVVAYATALQRAVGDLRNRLARFQEGGITEQQAATSYGGSIEEMKQVLAVLQMVSADFEAAYRIGNPSLSQSQWYREGFGLLTSAVLALPTVNLRNMTQGQFEVYIMSRAMGLGGHRLTMWRALKGMVRTVARYGLHIGGGAMKRVDLGVAMLTGKNTKMFEQLVDLVATLILQPDYKTSADTVLNLGYDSRDGFLDRMKRIWQETSEIADREDAGSIRLPGTQRKMAAVMGVPVKALRATFDKIGVLESDLTINSSLLTYATWLERRLEEVAMVYGAERRRLGLASFDAIDPRWQIKPDEWAAFSSQQANADSLSLFRLFLESSANAEGFQLERSLWDFYQKRSSGQHPKVFNPRQFDAVSRRLLSEFNASTPANRASAAAGNNVIRNLLTLQGYVSDGLLKLINTTIGGTRDRKAVGIAVSKLPVMAGLAVMATLIGYFAGAITGEWERRIRGRAHTLPTPLDRDFWTNWKRFGENTARLSAAQLFYIGDIILALRGEVQGNRGFDPVGRVFPISMVQRAFNSLRGMWTTQGTVADKLVPMADFGRSMTPWWLEVENAFGNAQGAIKQGERVLRGEAQVQGLLPEKRGQSFQDPSYGPTTVIRRKLGEAVSAYWKADVAGNAAGSTAAMADAQAQMAKLREFYEAKYTEAGLSPLEARTKAEADVWRDYQEINPAVAAMLGKRPTDGEWKLIRGGMSGERAKTVDDAVAAWQKGASVLFGRRGSITKEDVAANRPSSGASGGIAGMASAMPRGALPSVRRTSRLGMPAATSMAAPYSAVSGSRTRSFTRLRRPRSLRRRRTTRRSVLRRQRSPRVSTRRRTTRRRQSYIRA